MFTSLLLWGTDISVYKMLTFFETMKGIQVILDAKIFLFFWDFAMSFRKENKEIFNKNKVLPKSPDNSTRYGFQMSSYPTPVSLC
jgi:hypothetical protein